MPTPTTSELLSLHTEAVLDGDHMTADTCRLALDGNADALTIAAHVLANRRAKAERR